MSYAERANVNLKRLRIEAGLRQTDLADLALVARHHGSKCRKRSKHQHDSLQLLAEALGVPQNFIQDEQSVDAIAQGPFEIHHFLQGDLRPEPTAFCATVDDAIWACTAMRDSWNEHIKRSQSEPGANCMKWGINTCWKLISNGWIAMSNCGTPIATH